MLYFYTQRRVQPSQCYLQYKLLELILSAVCSVFQQSEYVLHFYYTLYDGKYDHKITMHQTIFQLQCFVLLNNHQNNCNITKSFLNVVYRKPQTNSVMYMYTAQLWWTFSKVLVSINCLNLSFITFSNISIICVNMIALITVQFI